MNKRLLVILILVAFLVTLISIGVKNLSAGRSVARVKKADSDNLTLLYERGKALYSKRNYTDAAKAFEMLIVSFPDSHVTEDSFLNLAKSYEAKSEYSNAKRTLEKFLKKYPTVQNACKIREDIEKLNIEALFSNALTENSFLYEIKKGDNLNKIASNFNTTVTLLKISNSLKNDIIIPGKSLKVNKAKFKILIDRSDNILLLKKSDNDIIKTYVVSTGENLSTPLGTFKIEEKSIKPPWYKPGGGIVNPDSSEYELGSRWMGLSTEGYGIHGTRDNSSIGKHITNGCVRMKNEEVEELFMIIPSGTEVTIVE